ncbi:MAG: NAD(P)-dependent oxidoreductase [Anaerolineae bacterium]|nr:NAD(P)-dependent oxidoreductase [Anaerolineae bacterium]
MALNTVAVLSPGDMGHSVGQRIREHGLRVITCLAGRSERTRALAREAGIEDVPSYDELVRQAEMLLSILVPAQAQALGEEVARALERTDAELVYVDCNAIAPQTVQAIGERVTAAGGRFVDAGIIGGPPRGGSTPRIYASGPHASEFAALGDYGLDVRLLEGPIGDASALKMCYAAMTKGSTALYTTLLTAAERLGISDALQAEFRLSQADAYARMARGIPGMTPKAHRWIGEMEEIASTFEHVGLSPHFHLGAAEIYRLVESTPLAERTPEDPTPPPDLKEVVRILAQALAAHDK